MQDNRVIIYTPTLKILKWVKLLHHNPALYYRPQVYLIKSTILQMRPHLSVGKGIWQQDLKIVEKLARKRANSLRRSHWMPSATQQAIFFESQLFFMCTARKTTLSTTHHFCCPHRSNLSSFCSLWGSRSRGYLMCSVKMGKDLFVSSVWLFMFPLKRVSWGELPYKRSNKSPASWDG